MPLPPIAPYLSVLAMLIAGFGAWTVHSFELHFWPGLGIFLGSLVLLALVYFAHWRVKLRLLINLKTEEDSLVVLEIAESEHINGREDTYAVRITNQSTHPIVVTRVWVEMDDGGSVEVIYSGYIGVTNGKIPAHIGVWQWLMEKNKLPKDLNCDNRVRATLLDGRILKSRRGKTGADSNSHITN
jgi:hypothetical protein